MKTFRKGGIHPHENKLTANNPILELPVPEELVIPTSQNIGATSKPCVKAGDWVGRGEMIAEAGGFVGAPIHSPVNGIIKKIEKVRNPQGFWQEAIILTPDPQDPLKHNFPNRSQEDIDKLSSVEIIDLVGKAGIVGLGGAAFPTRVKLSVPSGKKIDTVLINGA